MLWRNMIFGCQTFYNSCRKALCSAHRNEEITILAAVAAMGSESLQSPFVVIVVTGIAHVSKHEFEDFLHHIQLLFCRIWFDEIIGLLDFLRGFFDFGMIDQDIPF